MYGPRSQVFSLFFSYKRNTGLLHSFHYKKKNCCKNTHQTAQNVEVVINLALIPALSIIHDTCTWRRSGLSNPKHNELVTLTSSGGHLGWQGDDSSLNQLHSLRNHCCHFHCPSVTMSTALCVWQTPAQLPTQCGLCTWIPQKVYKIMYSHNHNIF